MIPNNTLDVVELAGELPGEVIDYSFNADALDHLMGVLTDMYEDTMMAPIREYSTNARDIHIECGVKRPIEITPPNRLSRFFIVQDFGSGLSKDEFKDIYTQYGASTKRESNDYNGSLGIGAKSAMTYTPVSNLTSVKDGIRYEVEVRRKASGGVEMKIIIETPDEVSPSGVTVRIPVASSDVDAFRSRIVNFFQWWEPETFKILGDLAVPYAKADLKPLGNSDRIFFDLRGNVHDDIVVMGNVAYPSPFPRLCHDRSVVYFADNGEAVFTRSREGLMTVDSNRQLLERIGEKVKTNFETEVKDVMAKAESELEAYTLLRKDVTSLCYSYYGHRLDVKDYADWNGINLFEWANSVNATPGAHEYFLLFRNGSKVAQHSTGSGIVEYLTSIGDTKVVVLDAPNSIKNYGSPSYDVLERALDSMGHEQDQAMAFLRDSVPEFVTKYIGEVKVITWSDVRKASAKSLRDSKPKVQVNTKEWEHFRIGGGGGSRYYNASYVIRADVGEVEDGGEGYIYVSRKDITEGVYTTGRSQSDRISDFDTLINNLDGGVYKGKVLLVPHNRKSTFTKRFPNAKSMEQVFQGVFQTMLDKAKEALAAIETSMSDDDLDFRARLLLLVLSNGYDNDASADTVWTHHIKERHSQAVDDPRFAAYYEVSSTLVRHTEAVDGVYEGQRILGLRRSALHPFLFNGMTVEEVSQRDPYRSVDVMAGEIAAAYPLLSINSYYAPELGDFINYINAMYASNNN